MMLSTPNNNMQQNSTFEQDQTSSSLLQEDQHNQQTLSLLPQNNNINDNITRRRQQQRQQQLPLFGILALCFLLLFWFEPVLLVLCLYVGGVTFLVMVFKRIFRPMFQKAYGATFVTKSVDFSVSLLLFAVPTTTGHVELWPLDNDNNNMEKVKLFVSTSPVRCAKFLRDDNIVAASNDGCIRIVDRETKAVVRAFQGNNNCIILSMELHPTLPYLLVVSDDYTLKLWDLECGNAPFRVFKEHSDIITQVKFNPQDTDIFATSSWDHTVKVWEMRYPDMSQFTLIHKTKVHCIDFCSSSEQLLLASGCEDGTIKIWDYETRSLISTLTTGQHVDSVVAGLMFHPTLPILVSICEHGKCRFWSNRAPYQTMGMYEDGAFPRELIMGGGGFVLAASNNNNNNDLWIGLSKGYIHLHLGLSSGDSAAGQRVFAECQNVVWT